MKALFGPIFVFLSVSSLLAQEIRVEDIQFKNNDEMSSGKLQNAMQTKANPWYRLFMPWRDSRTFDEEVFLTDLLRIEKLYQQEGYLEAIVKDYELNFNEEGDEVNIVIYINEGEATTVNRVEFLGSDHVALPIPPEQLRGMVKLKPGKRYREEVLREDYHKIIQKHSNEGYPYIEAKVKPVIDREAHLVDLEWYLNPGPNCLFGEIQITGNESVSDKVILRGLGFKPGDPFVRKKLASAQSQVYRLELFQFVSLEAMNLDEKPTNIPIAVRVRETTLRTLKFGLGYGSEEAFRTFGRWRHRNFLGGGRILQILGKHSTAILPLQLEVEMSQPYFLGNRNDLNVKPFFIWQDERSFEARRIGVETTLTRQLTSKTNAFVNTRIERDTVDVKVGRPVPEVEDLFNKSVVKVGITRNSTDQLFNPSSGSVGTVVAEEAGRFLSTRFKYLKFSGEYRKFHEIAPGRVFAWRFLIGSMGPIRGSNVTPVEERFFSGGSYSVRGWGRQLLGPLNVDTRIDTLADMQVDTVRSVVPVGGNSIIEGSFEFRSTIYKKLSGALFLDYGNVWENSDGYDFFDLRYALGAGLRYNTFIGPIRVDFAWKLNPQPLDDGRFQLHVSIGHAF